MRIQLVTVAAAALSTAFAGSAFAITVTESAKVGAAPDKVWAASAGDFCGIGQFHPAIEKCELSDGGKTRTLSLKGGGTIVEQETANKAGKSYSYIIKSSPLPIEDYKSTFSVKGSGSTSTVTWTGTFKAKGASDADAKKAIDGIYTSGLDALAKKF